ncbi:Ni-Fe hydrogenase, membrane subunit HyfF [hydrothermal vent metagenome]|uniref:Ni-Fe hydrogenase, membrane subunit HyfF n=1 Tax=hydrothermal vent metagenome TaxID=652676 RepID=A0A1W1CV01_9ZZZZ
MIDASKSSHHLLLMLGAIFLLLVLLSIIFYKFIEVYQSMKYEGKEHKKEVYSGELVALMIFAIALLILMLPSSLSYLRSI